MKFDFKSHTITWLDRTIPMKSTRNLLPAPEQTELLVDAEFFADVIIKERSYEAVTPDQVVAQLPHLDANEKQQLKQVFSKYATVFDGKLGCHPTEFVKLELHPNAKPHWQKPYPVPYTRKEQFTKELASMVKDGILVPVGPSPWGFPSFIIPKKDDRVRWISDFRALNLMIVRKPYPLPRIQDIMQERGTYKYFTKIDLSMMFYCFRLDPASQRICVITTEFGNFSYTRLPMGVKVSPDIAQAAMAKMLYGIDCSAYMDDVGIWSNGTFEQHLKIVDKVLERFQKNNMKCNPLKCEWAVKETDFLGFWMTPEGIKPWKKRIDAILKMDRPRNTTDVRAFIGAVNHYKSLWPRRAHVLAPLAEMTGRGTFIWNDA